MAVRLLLTLGTHYNVSWMELHIWSRSDSQPFPGACSFLQMVHFELVSIVRVKVRCGEVEKEERINYWDFIIWKGQGQIPGEDISVSPLPG